MQQSCRFAGGTRLTDPQGKHQQTDVTGLLHSIAGGDRLAADSLLPVVYDELRRLARAQMKNEPAGHTLQPTALVHEAYLRLIGKGSGHELTWESRGHFFAAAALAMRHILVERARRQAQLKRGGDPQRIPLYDTLTAPTPGGVDLVALDAALNKLEQHNERVAQVVMLRYFAGLGIEDAARALGVGATTVKTEWSYARIWLHREMSSGAAQ